MSEQERVYKEQIKALANGRTVCNCGEAYSDSKGGCPYGCSSNLIRAKYEVVSSLVKAQIFAKGFFEGKTIDQLIAEQGVEPIADLSTLSGIFPDDDIDEMLADIHADRMA